MVRHGASDRILLRSACPRMTKRAETYPPPFSLGHTHATVSGGTWCAPGIRRERRWPWRMGIGSRTPGSVRQARPRRKRESTGERRMTRTRPKPRCGTTGIVHGGRLDVKHTGRGARIAPRSLLKKARLFAPPPDRSMARRIKIRAWRGRATTIVRRLPFRIGTLAQQAGVARGAGNG